jgi:hypothetical protein
VSLNGVASPDEVTVWTGVTGGRVTFNLLESGGANIVLGFRGGADICGVTNIFFTDEGFITAANVRVSQAIYRTPVCVRTVTHEIAHAIGFLDHTADGGLMDPDGGNGQITPEVSDTLTKLYSFPPNTPVTLGERLRLAGPPTGRRRAMTFAHPPRS